MADLISTCAEFQKNKAIQGGAAWFAKQLVPFVKGGCDRVQRQALTYSLIYGLAESFVGAGLILGEELRFEGEQSLQLTVRNEPDFLVKKAALRCNMSFTDAIEGLNLVVNITPAEVTGRANGVDHEVWKQ